MSGVGISFGNSTASIAVCRDGRSDVVANDAGERATATNVACLENEILTGTPATQLHSRQPQNVVRCLKSLLGQKLDAVNTAGAKQNCKLDEHNNEIIVNFSTCRKSVSSLTKDVFTHIKATADSALGESEHETVIGVPLNCSAQFKDALSKCATAAGFKVLGTLPEPLAAVLAYDADKVPEDGNTVVFRVGGSSTSATLINSVSGCYSVVKHIEEVVGGNQLDEALSKFLISEFDRKYKCSMSENTRSVNKILRAASLVKHNLSTVQTSECNVESVYEGMDLQTNVSRPRFETLAQDGLGKFVSVLKDLLSKSENSPVNRVIFTGGSCRIAKLQSLVRSILPNATILNSIPSGEVLAQGFAQHAYNLLQNPAITNNDCEEDGTVPITLCPSDINVRVGDTVTKIISRNTPLPTTTELSFAGGDSVSLEADNVSIASIAIGSEDKSTLSIHIEVFEDCSLEAILKDVNTSERATIHVPAPAASA